VDEVDAKLLVPLFEKAFWRRTQSLLFRKHPEFSPKRKHFEPENHSRHAERFASDLTLEECREEIRRIYENSVILLKNKRSRMERGDQSLDAAQFRFTINVTQDSNDPAFLLYERVLVIKIALNELPSYFDDLFPWKATEIVIPFDSRASQREILEILEHWEERLGGKLEESANQELLKLNLRSGFSMTVDLSRRELVFAKENFEGVVRLATAISGDLQSLGIKKELG